MQPFVQFICTSKTRHKPNTVSKLPGSADGGASSLASMSFLLSRTVWLVSVSSDCLVSHVVASLSLGGADCCVVITGWRRLLRGYHWVAQFVASLSLGGANCYVVITGRRRLLRGYHWVAQFVRWLSLGSAVCHVVITW